MTQEDLYNLTGEYEYAIDVIYKEDGGLRVITNWDVYLEKLSK